MLLKVEIWLLKAMSVVKEETTSRKERKIWIKRLKRLEKKWIG
jgi:hypothetical protein